MRISPKYKIESFVEDLNRNLNDSFFLPNRPDGEFKFKIKQIDSRCFSCYFGFEDNEMKLPLVKTTFAISLGDDLFDGIDCCLEKFYISIFRYAHFSLDYIDSKNENGVNNFTIKTLFKEGLKQLKQINNDIQKNQS